MECFTSNYVRKELLDKLNQRITQFEKLMGYEGLDTKSNRTKLEQLKQTYQTIYDMEVCRNATEPDGGSYNLTQEQEKSIDETHARIKTEPKKSKKGRKASERSLFMGDCMRSPSKGGAGKSMKECSQLWKSGSHAVKSAEGGQGSEEGDTGSHGEEEG